MSPPEDLTDVVGQPDPDVQRRDRLQRWRLVLAPAAGDGTGLAAALSRSDARRDEVLEQLYGDGDRRGGLGGSAPPRRALAG